MTPLGWDETWQEHVKTALCVDLLNEGNLSVDDLHAILTRLRKAAHAVHLEIARQRLSVTP